MNALRKRILPLIMLCLLAAPAWGYLGVPFEELKKAAEAGDPDAQNKVGVLFAQGIGLQQNKAAAFHWYKKAADAKYPPAMWNLAFMYVRGEGGVKEDLGVAFGLFKESAELGHAEAQFDLAYMYLQGIGTTLNREEGMKWLEKAAAQGQRDAGKLLKELQEQEKPSTAAGHQKPVAK